MKILLRSMPQPEYPTEYLAARLRGRRTGMIIDWKPFLGGQQSLPVSSDQTIQADFSEELLWLYRQMNSSLRFDFHNIFLYYELRTLILALRFMAGKQKAVALELVKRSLLNEDILLLLQKNDACLPFLHELTGYMKAWPELHPWLKNQSAANDFKACEIMLFSMMLQNMARQETHPLLLLFIKLHIDFHNSLNLLKHDRWLRQRPDRVIPGGNRNHRMLLRLINRKFGEANLTPLVLNEAAAAFIKDMHLELHHQFRAYDTIGLILEYIWLQYIERVNFGILLHSEDLPLERTARELIR